MLSLEHLRRSGLVASVVIVGLLSGCGSAPTTIRDAPPSVASSPTEAPPSSSEASPTPTESEAPAPPAPEPAPATESAAQGTALALLATLPIKGRAPKTGYDRDLFGSGWVDVDHNGCDTRNDMLRTQLTAVAFVNQVACKVQSGILNDPYTATVINFVRGQDTSNDVQIDHVVALSDAWQKGAQQLSPDRRVTLANDPLNLQATDGPTNQRKSDGDAATWLPPNKGYRCEYVARQISVKSIYSLWVTQAEHDAMAGILSSCPDQPSYGSGFGSAAAAAPAQPAPAPAEPAPAPAQPAPAQPAPAPAPGGDVYYKNCTAARAAGAAPLHVGQPGYRPAMDGDKDGIACE